MKLVKAGEIMASFSDFVDPNIFKKFDIKNDLPKSFSPNKKQKTKIIYSNARSNSKKSSHNNNQILVNATAPYNFVALPKRILPSPMDKDRDLLCNENDKTAKRAFQNYITDIDRLYGEILLDIEVLTPLFIGGNHINNTCSFAPIDTKYPIIPGSSLRGMFKNIFKIVTCGAMRGEDDLTDEHVYFRCLMTTRNSPAWMSDLNKLYNDRMTSKRNGKLVKNARPGFLIKKSDGKYVIAPSIYRSDRKEDRILIKEYEKQFKDHVEMRNDSRVTWHGNEAYIITGSQNEDKLYCKNCYKKLKPDLLKSCGKQFIRFTKIDYVDWCVDHWLEIGEEVLSSYKHDRNRRGVNLFSANDNNGFHNGYLNGEQLHKIKPDAPDNILTIVPCHFLEENGHVTAFGHGQCFRIPYKNKISNAISDNIKDDKIIDFADAIFGKKEFWAGRVFFEDAISKHQIQILPTAEEHPLMQPNPTSYQLYLKQDDDKLNHWDSKNAKIRGYKMYWHNKDYDWKATGSEIQMDTGKAEDKKLIKKITPIGVNDKNHFYASIRFKNLSKIELGALMMIFDLDGKGNQAAYKIGQGKSLGCGSIRIKSQLFIEDKTAYTQLFDNNGWKDSYIEVKATEYLEAFRKYIKECDMTSDWQNVMKELNAILNWNQTDKEDWHKKIRPMSGNVQNGTVDERFKNRNPLPTILEVVGK